MQKELLRIWSETKKTVIFITHSVDEALFLADRIVVMTARPSNIGHIYEISGPGPATGPPRSSLRSESRYWPNWRAW